MVVMCTNAGREHYTKRYCVRNEWWWDARERACRRNVCCQKTERHAPTKLLCRRRRSGHPPRRRRYSLLRRHRPWPMAVAPRPACPPATTLRSRAAYAHRSLGHHLSRPPQLRPFFIFYFPFQPPRIFTLYCYIAAYCFFFFAPLPLFFFFPRTDAHSCPYRTYIDECCYANIYTDMRACVCGCVRVRAKYTCILSAFVQCIHYVTYVYRPFLYRMTIEIIIRRN